MPASRKQVRQRAAGVEGQTRLTDIAAGMIMSDHTSKVLNEPIVWVTADRTGELRFRARVYTGLSATLTLTGRMSGNSSFRSHWLLLWGDPCEGEKVESLRRLDLRDDHYPNSDGQEWHDETHKHLWSEEHKDGFAYTPTDIPHDQNDLVGPDDYRAICEAFVQECGIVFGPDYSWSDPDFTEAATQTLWSAP